MKDFEQQLRDLPKPHLETPVFKQNLRRGLLRHAPNPAPWGQGFLLPLATVAAGFFGVLCLMFVLRPEMPAAINQWATGTSVQEPPMAVELPVNARQNPEYRTFANQSQLPNLTGNPNRNAMFAEKLSVGQDEAYLREWLTNLNQDQVRPESAQNTRAYNVTVRDEGLLSVRRFVTEDGREMLVYTRVVDDQKTIY